MLCRKRTRIIQTREIKNVVIEKGVDIVGLTENNQDWRLIDYNQSIWNVTKSWKERCRIQTSNNTTSNPTEKHQVGGTATKIFNETVFRISQQGQDKRHLGRWSYIDLQEKNNFRTTIITCYCPVISSGPSSCYS